VMPVRTCVGCGQREPKAKLMRMVGTAPGLALGATAPGRGAYLHVAPACWEAFVRRRGPIRSLRQNASREEREQLVASLHGAEGRA
jgi:uncharacterized protein